MKTIESMDLKELTTEELTAVNGGESLWYWVAYGVGTAAHAVVDAAEIVYEFYKETGPIRPSEYR